ncbi:MAG: hypothetical protein Q7R56_03420 [Nanoarchaeota archaeon]|nr:hypothetical protein [Nanoarchaeota archaeon]
MDRAKEGVKDITLKLTSRQGDSSRLTTLSEVSSKGIRLSPDVFSEYKYLLETFPTRFNGGLGINRMKEEYCSNCLRTQGFHDLGSHLVCERCTKRLERTLPVTTRPVWVERAAPFSYTEPTTPYQH